VLEELLAGLFHIARADGPPSRPELSFLRRVAEIFGFDEAQFGRVRDRFMPAPEADPYDVLGLAQDASDEEVKKTYRRLIREHHPDGLLARGLPRDRIGEATGKMAAINAAYDIIAKRRGLT
jgi:DnaJ like chaperone protein